MRLILGQVLWFAGDPFRDGPGAARHARRGAVAVEGGRIAAVGDADALRAAHPAAEVTDYGEALISAGFVDAHAH
jgi:guanine deaminase